MSESIQITPSVNTATQKSKSSPLDMVDNPESSDDLEGFTAVFASYSDEPVDVAEQQKSENIAEIFSEMLPQDISQNGNSLPEGDKEALWQAFMLIQPAEVLATNANPALTPVLTPTSDLALTPTSNVIKNMGLFEKQGKPVLSSPLLNQSYFQSLNMQNKEPGTSIPAGLAANNISAQLAAANFIPEMKESVLLNINEQLVPVQGTSSTLSQGLSAIGFGTASQAAITQTQMAPLNLGQNAWETNLGSRLQMLVGQNIQSAEIRLDPPELGALDIKIKVSNDVATVNITSAHSQVREALESAVPKLREMFAESGVSLGDVNVRQESFAQQQNSTEHEEDTLKQMADSELGDEPSAVTRKIVSDNLLDIYA